MEERAGPPKYAVADTVDKYYLINAVTITTTAKHGKGEEQRFLDL
jgi:hypothetical protein